MPQLELEIARMIELQSTVTCPACGEQAAETMRTDACQYLHVCRNCGLEMKPKKGDCCVYCSYGSVPCPPIQKERIGLINKARCAHATVICPDRNCRQSCPIE